VVLRIIVRTVIAVIRFLFIAVVTLLRGFAVVAVLGDRVVMRVGAVRVAVRTMEARAVGVRDVLQLTCRMN